MLSLYVVGLGELIPLPGLFVIAAILSSTDPIAVGALLKELDAPHKLHMIIEGESLINDGTSIVCFQVLVEIYKGSAPNIGRILMNICTLCIGGPALGLVMGLIFTAWMRRVVKDAALMVSLTFVNCFLIFFLCEYFPWNISGLLAIVTAAIVHSAQGKSELVADELWSLIETVWKFAQFVGESVLFILTGLIIGQEVLKLRESSLDPWRLSLQIFGFFILMNIARLLMVLLFLPFYNSKSNHHEFKIGFRESIVIAYSGIRGALPLIIVLMISKAEDFPIEFKQVAVLTTILTITLGIIFNGMTIKPIIKKLKVIPTNPIQQKWNYLSQKDIFNKLVREMTELRRKPDFSVAKWNFIGDLCGLGALAEEIAQQETDLRSSYFNSVSLNQLMAVETRMRVLCSFKNFVLEQLKTAQFSPQSASALLEVADFAEETADKALGLWEYLEETIQGNYTLKALKFLVRFERAEPFVRHLYFLEQAHSYELVHNFVTAIDSIMADQFFLENIPADFVKQILEELEDQKKFALSFSLDLTSKSQIVVQLYQTKRACKSLLFKRRKAIKELMATGVLEDEDFNSLMIENKQMLFKIENFSFEVNDGLINEIFDSCSLFSDLNSEDKDLLHQGYKKLVFGPGEMLFGHSDESSGIFMLLDGSAEEFFANRTKKTRLFGSILGVRCFLDDRLKYGTDVRCASKCTFAFFPLFLLQKLLPDYPQMEQAIYYSCLLNVLSEKEQETPAIRTMGNMIDLFELHKCKKHQIVVTHSSFMLLKGVAKRKVVADRRNPDFKPSDDSKELPLFYTEMNGDHLTFEIIAKSPITLITFRVTGFKELDAIRSSSMRQSHNLFNEARKIEETFDRMANFMKLNS